MSKFSMKIASLASRARPFGTVQLADVIDVKVFQDMPSNDSPERTAFFQSGIVTNTPLLNALANAPGVTAELPFWNDLDQNNDPNLSDDNPANTATPDKIAQSEQTTRKAFLNQGWSTSDLASELAMGPKAMDRIKSRVDVYWLRQWQRRIIAAAKGVLADNVANDSSDMVFNIAGQTNGDVKTSTVFSRQNFTSSVFTLGDRWELINAIAVHSIVFKRMVDNDDIDFIKPSVGTIEIPYFLGRRVVVDDSMPFTAAGGVNGGDAAPQYTSILFGLGAFGYGEGTPEYPVEVARNAAQGNGGGVETLWTRKTWILHPYGYKCIGTPIGANKSLTVDQLAAAASWDRVIERKNVPLAFLVTNG